MSEYHKKLKKEIRQIKLDTIALKKATAFWTEKKVKAFQEVNK